MADDPTRNERQRLYRARRKADAAGLVEVWVGDRVDWLPTDKARAIVKWMDEQEGKDGADEVQGRGASGTLRLGSPKP
jgi:hypothetical protein